MMYQTPFWSGTTTGGRDVYAPQQEGVRGQVERWVLPQFDTGDGGWAYEYTQPAPGDPELLRMGFQQTGIFGGPGGRGELYRGPQTPPIGVPVGFGTGIDGVDEPLPPPSTTTRLRGLRALKAVKRQRQLQRQRPQRPQQPGMGSVSDGMAMALVFGLFIGVPAVIGWIGKQAQPKWQQRERGYF
jgi:hypothetical protein